MARYPVTVGQYRQFVEDDGYKDSAGGRPADSASFPNRTAGRINSSILRVRWSMSVGGKRRRTAHGRVTVCPPKPSGNGRHEEPRAASTLGRRSAKAGACQLRGKQDWPSHAGWHLSVGCDAGGDLDLGGNVWEWCADWDGKYPAGSVQNPRGPKKAGRRVYRGGCWAGGAGTAGRRVAMRTSRRTATGTWAFAWPQFRPKGSPVPV